MPGPGRRERGIFSGFVFHIERTEKEEFDRLRNLIISNSGGLRGIPHADLVTHIVVFTPTPPSTFVDMTAYQRSNKKTYSQLISGSIKWSTDELINTFARREGADEGPRPGKTVLKAEWIDICVERMSPLRMDNYLGMEIMVKASAPPPTPIPLPVPQNKPRPALLAHSSSLTSRISTRGEQSDSLPDTRDSGHLRQWRRSPSPGMDRRGRSLAERERERSARHQARRSESPPSLPLPDTRTDWSPYEGGHHGRRRSPSPSRKRRGSSSREESNRPALRRWSPSSGFGRDSRHGERENGSGSRWSREALAAAEAGLARDAPEESRLPARGVTTRQGQPSLLARSSAEVRAGSSSTAPPVIIPPGTISSSTLRAPFVEAPRAPPSTSTAPAPIYRALAPLPPPLLAGTKIGIPPSAMQAPQLVSGRPALMPSAVPAPGPPGLRAAPNPTPARLAPRTGAITSSTTTFQLRPAHPVSPAVTAAVPRAPAAPAARPLPSAAPAAPSVQIQLPSPAAVILSAIDPPPHLPSPTVDRMATDRPTSTPAVARIAVPAAAATPSTSPTLDLADQETAVKAEPGVTASAAPSAVPPARPAAAGPPGSVAPAPSERPATSSLTPPPDRAIPQIKASPSSASTAKVQPPAPGDPTLPSSAAVPASQAIRPPAAPGASAKAVPASPVPNVKQEKRAGDEDQPISIDSSDDDHAPISLRAAKQVKQEGKKAVKVAQQPTKAGPSTLLPAKKAAPAVKSVPKPTAAAGPSVKPREPGQSTARPRPGPIAVPKPKSTTVNKPTFSSHASSSRLPSASTAQANPPSSPATPIIGTKRPRTKRRIEDSSEDDDDIPLSAGRKKKIGAGDGVDSRKAGPSREKANDRRTSAGPSSQLANRARYSEATPPTNARYPSPAPTPARQIIPARTETASAPASAGLDKIFVNSWGTPVTFHVVMDVEGLSFAIPHLVEICGGQLVDIAAATFIILPKSPGAHLTTDISSLLGQESLNSCHGKLLVSYHYIRDCNQEKKMINIDGYKVELVAPPIASASENVQEEVHGAGRGRNEMRGMRTPDSIGERQPAPVFSRVKRERAGGTEETSDLSDISSSSEEDDQSDFEGDDDDRDTNAERSDDDEPLASRTRASTSTKVISPGGRTLRDRRKLGKKAKRARTGNEKLEVVQKEDMADYAWLKGKLLAWDGKGSRGKFFDDLAKKNHKRSWFTFYKRYRERFEDEVPALLAHVRLGSRSKPKK